jgi:hypothetical protein
VANRTETVDDADQVACQSRCRCSDRNPGPLLDRGGVHLYCGVERLRRRVGQGSARGPAAGGELGDVARRVVGEQREEHLLAVPVSLTVESVDRPGAEQGDP